MPEAGEMLQGKVVDGRFHLGRYLGGSERSAVFLTERQQGSPRTAAIKLIPADPKNADMQLSQWRLLSRLSHPHLLQIFEAGRCRHEGEDVLYVVMEYAEENLAQVLSDRALTAEESREMLLPTLDTLAYLHGRGFIHGRVKPSNILVAGEKLKLSSDGISRIGEPAAADTGTYGPPELPGAAAAPPRDVWSLGVTLVQVLTQLLPVRNGDGQGVTLPENLPAPFGEVAENCLQAEPDRRCTLAEIAERLHYKLPARTLGPPEIPAAAPAAAAEVRRPAPVKPIRPARSVRSVRSSPPVSRKNQSVLPAVAVVIFTLVAIFAGRGFFGQQAAPAESTSTASVPATTVQAPAAPVRASRPSPAAPLRAQAPAPAQVSRPLAGAPALRTASAVNNVAPASSASSFKPQAIPPSGSLVPGGVAHQVLPSVPQGASNTIRGTVRVTVRVRVDPAGNVAGVALVSPGPSAYFARLATDAARQWKFSPATRGGQAVASAWNVRFEFIRGGVRAIPEAAL